MNKCIKCNEPVGNLVFTICDDCWKVESALPRVQSRCCGRCDGVHDICVADMVCDTHNVLGCEDCYGKR